MAIAYDDAPFACDFEPDNDAADASGPEVYPYADFREKQAEREREAVKDAKANVPPWAPPQLCEVPPDWYAEAPPKRSWLLRDRRHPKSRGVFPLGKVGQIIGEGGVSKTMLLCQAVVSVTTGTPFLGAFDVPTPGRGLLILGEEDAEEARRRIYHATRASHARGPDPGAIVVLPLAGVHSPLLEPDKQGLRETEFLVWLRAYVKAGDFRLVGVDPLSRFAGPEAETDNAAATRFIQALESIVTPSCSLLNVHHTNKMSRGVGAKLDASSGRGSSAFVDGARWQAALSVEQPKLDGAEEQERLGEVVTFYVTKSNYAAKPDPVVLRRDHDNGGALVPVDASDLETIEGAKQGALLDTPRRQARKAEARSEAEAIDTAVLRIVGANPGINQTDLRDKVRGLTFCGDPAARAAIARVDDRLTKTPGLNRSVLYRLRVPS